MKTRENYQPPVAIEKWRWRYHHIGIPTNTPAPGERYIPHLKLYVSGFDSSPFGIEWMRFDEDCPVSDLVKTIPHIAFEVDDLDKELGKPGLKIISGPSEPSEGVRVAMIEHNGAPVELIEFRRAPPG
jgi:catechol 2,3-dioxygenase-like lactoylglutathione lyase family enzyme